MVGYVLNIAPDNTGIRAYRKRLLQADIDQGRRDYTLLGNDPIEKRIRLDKKNVYGKLYPIPLVSNAPLSRWEYFEPMLLAAPRSGKYCADASVVYRVSRAIRREPRLPVSDGSGV